jgi:hypothetical protein
MTHERKILDQQKDLFAQERQNFNQALEHQRLRMEQDKSSVLQLEQNEWECHQSEKEQTFMKLESNVAAVCQKLVEDVESLREHQLEKSRSNFAEAKVNYKIEKERFEAEICILQRKVDSEREELEFKINSLKEEVSYEQKRNKNSLSTLSTLRNKIDKMQHQLYQKTKRCILKTKVLRLMSYYCDGK